MSIPIVRGKARSAALSPMAWRWIAVAAVACVDAILLARTGIRVSPSFLLTYGKALAAWALLTFVCTCLLHNARLAAMTQMVLQASLFSVAAAIFSYLALTFPAPLMDERFTALDSMLGLDWMAWFRWVDSHRPVREILILAYESLAAQLVVTIVLLPWIGRQTYVSELSTASMAALLVIIPVWALVPALGPWVHFGIGVAQADWLPDVLAMRDGTMRILGEHALHGIIVLPSFHTVLAMLLVHAMRWNRLTLALSAGLNALVLLSVPSVGSHYFVDAAAGAAVGLLAIAVARRIESAARDENRFV